MASSGWKRLIPVVTAVGCAAVTSIPAPAQPAHAARVAIAARKLRGGGGWQGNADARRGVQRWDIDVTRADDDSLAGRVTVAGSPLMQSGALRGMIDGRRIEGSITDEAGNHVATFVGTVTPSGIQGTYQDRTGEVGRWTWDGELPR